MCQCEFQCRHRVGEVTLCQLGDAGNRAGVEGVSIGEDAAVATDLHSVSLVDHLSKDINTYIDIEIPVIDI